MLKRSGDIGPNSEANMRLDEGEKIELEESPSEKILTVWFFTKTITYSIATMFFLFMAIFFVNALTTISTIEQREKSEIVEQSDLVDKGVDDKSQEVDVNHPFIIFVEYWGWALAVVGLISIAIQIYLIFLRKTYRYIITNRRCIFIGGILKRVERTVPHKKITDIQRSQNILERILGVWNVQVFTPGTASMQIGQAKSRAELNYNGVINSEVMYEVISRHTQLN